MEKKRKVQDPAQTEEVEVEEFQILPSMSKWSQNSNKRQQLEKYAVSSLPPSVVFQKLEGNIFDVYSLNVRVVSIHPLSELQFVRGHCPHYTCNSTVTDINWAEAGPLTYGRLVRPYCPECCQTRRKRYLNLYFHLELNVEDNLGHMLKIIVKRDAAVRFLGLTVYRFLTISKRRQSIKEMLETLLHASRSPRSAPTPGFTFDIRIIPVCEEGSDVLLQMHDANLPLFELSRMCKNL